MRTEEAIAEIEQRDEHLQRLMGTVPLAWGETLRKLLAYNYSRSCKPGWPVVPEWTSGDGTFGWIAVVGDRRFGASVRVEGGDPSGVTP